MNFLNVDQNCRAITLQNENNSYNCLVNQEEFIAIQNGGS